MEALAKLCDRISGILVIVASVALVLLGAVTCGEVVARYVFNAPTIWAYDVINLLNGSLFVLGIAYTQRMGGHVRIDLLTSKLPIRLEQGIMLTMMVVLLLPVFGLLAYECTRQAWGTFVTNRMLESGWRIVQWPFLFPQAVGLWALFLQCVATVLRIISNPQSLRETAA